MQDASNQRAKRIKAAIATFAVGFAVLIGLGAFVLTANAPSRLVRIGAPGVKALGPAGATVLGSALHRARLRLAALSAAPAGDAALFRRALDLAGNLVQPLCRPLWLDGHRVSQLVDSVALVAVVTIVLCARGDGRALPRARPLQPAAGDRALLRLSLVRGRLG
jgi:hypothetical protein